MPAQIKISDLPVATSISDTSTAILPIVDAGTTSQISVNNFASSPRNQISLFSELRETTLENGVFLLGIGNNDLYTVPVGRTAVIGGGALSNTGLVTDFTAYVEVKHNGTYYRASTSLTLSNNEAATLNTMLNPLVLDAGDTLSANVITTAGGYAVFTIIEFSSSKSAIVPAHIFGTTTGDNTLYTCPVGKTAFPIAINPTTETFRRPPIGFGIGAVAPGNTGTSIVKSGGSPTIIVQGLSAIATTNGVSSTAFTGYLAAGDSAIVTVATGDSAHFLSGAFIEIDA